VLYSDGIERDREPELNRLLREMTVHRLDKLIADLQADQLALRAALERQGKINSQDQKTDPRQAVSRAAVGSML
jgi:ribosomal protein L29